MLHWFLLFLTLTECLFAALFPSNFQGWILRVVPQMALHVSSPSFTGVKLTKHAQMMEQQLVTFGVQGQRTMTEMVYNQAARVEALTFHLYSTQ